VLRRQMTHLGATDLSPPAFRSARQVGANPPAPAPTSGVVGRDGAPSGARRPPKAVTITAPVASADVVDGYAAGLAGCPDDRDRRFVQRLAAGMSAKPIASAGQADHKARARAYFG
jgi:hypothetical protein